MYQVLLIVTKSSACVTSILRSYYTWQTVESHDTSWELIPMGLWTWAEVSTGIIVGCLPTMPKFFQHIGSKVHRSTSENKDGLKSSAATNAPRLNVIARAKRPFAKYGVGSTVFDGWNDSHTSPDQSHNEYVVLDDAFDGSLPGVTTPCAPMVWPDQNIATARDDLEYKQREKRLGGITVEEQCGKIQL